MTETKKWSKVKEPHFPSYKRVKLFKITRRIWGWTMPQIHRRLAEIDTGVHKTVDTEIILGTKRSLAKRRKERIEAGYSKPD